MHSVKRAGRQTNTHKHVLTRAEIKHNTQTSSNIKASDEVKNMDYLAAVQCSDPDVHMEAN